MSSSDSESLQQSLNPEVRQMKRPKLLPAFDEMLMMDKFINLDGPQSQLTGFKISTQMGLGPKLQVATEFNLSPKKAQPQTPQEMMMMKAMSEPYFRLMLNYIGGNLKNIMKTGMPSWMMSVRTNTNHDMEFSLIKHFGNFQVKLMSIIQHQMGMMLPMYMLDLSHRNNYSTQSVTLGENLIKMNLVQNLGSHLTLGFEYQHVIPQRMKLLSWIGKYHRNPFETYFMRFEERDRILSLGSKIRIDRRTKIGTTIELHEKGSVATVGFERNLKRFTLNSKINSNGELRSNFKIKQGVIALKLFLAGKLKQEDYSTGVHLSLDPTQ